MKGGEFYMPTVAKGRLRELIKERGMTQVELSEKTGIPQGTISRFDRNNRHEATHLLALSHFFNVCINDLFDEQNEDGSAVENVSWDEYSKGK
jgi:transcriptional regulator with XRE-family HTH domain